MTHSLLDRNVAHSYGEAVQTAVTIAARHVGAVELAFDAEADWMEAHPGVDLGPLVAALNLTLVQLADKASDE